MSTFNPFNIFELNKTANASNQTLTTINGSFSVSNIHLSNTLINGNANLGKKTQKTVFAKILVVNGNLYSEHVSFETLEVNGNSSLDSCIISINGVFLGNSQFTNCKLNSLDLRGKDFTIKDSTVTGGIIITAILGSGKLILDNTIVEGGVKFTKDNGEIILKNGARVISS